MTDQPPFTDFDELDDELRPTAQRVHDVLTAGRPRPAFRDRLRADLLATHAQLAPARTGTQPLSGGRPGAGDVLTPPAGPIPDGIKPLEDPAAGPARPDSDRPDQARPDSDRPEPARPDSDRPDQARPDSDRPDQARPEPGRPDQARPEPGRPAGRPANRRRRPRAWLLGAAVAAAVAVAVAVAYTGLPGVGPSAAVAVSVRSDAAGEVSADPGAPVRLTFSRALDHAATIAALRVTPATDVQATWQDDTLTVTPAHGFAPNAPYVLTIDHSVARTGNGARLTADVRVAFGTAPVPQAGALGAQPVTVGRNTIAAADPDAEAVFTASGDLLATAAQADGHRGLLRIGDAGTVRLSGATSAICTSRSGQSVAYLTSSGTGTRIVFADAEGNPTASVPVRIDDDSPEGWIDDLKVTYVSGGRLTSVDRRGATAILSAIPIDTAKDTLDFAPGGRYAYLRPDGSTAGQLIDLVSGTAQALPAMIGKPSFTGDGATVAWLETTGGKSRIVVRASGGGPVQAVALPVADGDAVSGLALSRDGSRFVYSVTFASGRTELRVAALPDAATLVVSPGANGDDPYWSPSGNMVAFRDDSVLAKIELPRSALDQRPGWPSVAAAFVNAQLSADRDAQQALGTANSAFPVTPKFSRGTVLWGLPGSGGTATVGIRLIQDDGSAADGTAGHGPRQCDETLEMGTAADGSLVIRKVVMGTWNNAPAGPQLSRVDTGSVPGTAQLVFDSDLDPAAVTGTVTVSTPDGKPVAATVTYQAATRTLSIRADLTGITGTALNIAIGKGLKDVRDRSYAGLSPVAVILAA